MDVLTATVCVTSRPSDIISSKLNAFLWGFPYDNYRISHAIGKSEFYFPLFNDSGKLPYNTMSTRKYSYGVERCRLLRLTTSRHGDSLTLLSVDDARTSQETPIALHGHTG
jgi:hypothetical protein